MAKVFGLEVPFHGMLYGRDGSLSYFKRFDRYGKGKNMPQKDFNSVTRIQKYKIVLRWKIDSCT
jgi:serine/threonine-protein kinase HipA